MGLFLGLGIAGVVLLAAALIFDGVLEGVFDGALDAFDGLVSLPVLAGFLSMFGFASALTLGVTGLDQGASAAVGLAAGLGTGWLTWRVCRTLMREQPGDSPRGADLVGTAGSVVTAIPADGYGEVMLHLAGQPVKLAARSAAPVARGTQVWVEATLSATAVAVQPVTR
ncbi:hypothetical protein SRB5_30300 [Streptomyces sp. RB5]|uniref:NfeD-like C-terminal domain-containing protein n=1 Tax=Streptomyces smaragdinus TaxID=2585196 RepID=A0A7K0CHD3_9ACTN|nr:hypothetical protein [Streptomyces smaragdinus]MQY12891.1 hypothetical protein [Streptomyces smaragdinus]